MLRRLIATSHRWVGFTLAAYVAVVCATGAILVYRVELHNYFERGPVTVAIGPALLSDDALARSARDAFPDETPLRIWRGAQPNHAAEIQLEGRWGVRGHLFDPYTGEALGPPLPLGIRITEKLLELHKELLTGGTGRAVNGVAALSFVFLGLIGLIVWKPQKRRAPRTRSTSGSRAGTLRYFHMKLGRWTAAHLIMWGITGVHLVYPGIVWSIADRFEPYDMAFSIERLSDQTSYWLSFLHFGRFGDRLPGCGKGICDQTFKAIWALAGLTPVFLGGTGLFLFLRRIRARMAVKRRATACHSGQAIH